MSYNTDLQAKNTRLQNLLDTINALPDAGSGGGSNVKTCTVTCSVASSLSSIRIQYTSLVDGESTFNTSAISNGTILQNCLCNSIFIVIGPDMMGMINSSNSSGIELIDMMPDSSYMNNYSIGRILDNDTATISITA